MNGKTYSLIRASLVCVAVLLVGTAVASAQTYKPGDKVEYKTQSWPTEKWEVGTVERMTPEGKQVIIRSAPREFYPQGDTRAYSLDEVRPLGAGNKEQNDKTRPPTDNPPKETGRIEQSKEGGGSLMTQAEILSFLQNRLGDKPFSVESAKREQAFKDLAQEIMDRGVDFRYEVLSKFGNELGKFGATSTVTFPIEGNYGPPPKQSWLMGAWDTSIVAVGHIVSIGAKAGMLTINGNGTFVWKAYPTDPPAKYIRGRWRKATVEEMQDPPSYRGGDGIVLLNAKTGYDWLVTKDRVTTLAGDWIDIAELKSRQMHEGGKRR